MVKNQLKLTEPTALLRLAGFCEAYLIALPLKGFTEDFHSSSGKAAVSLSKPPQGPVGLSKIYFGSYISVDTFFIWASPIEIFHNLNKINKIIIRLRPR